MMSKIFDKVTQSSALWVIGFGYAYSLWNVASRRFRKNGIFIDYSFNFISIGNAFQIFPVNRRILVYFT